MEPTPILRGARTSYKVRRDTRVTGLRLPAVPGEVYSTLKGPGPPSPPFLQSLGSFSLGDSRANFGVPFPSPRSQGVTMPGGLGLQEGAFCLPSSL